MISFDYDTTIGISYYLRTLCTPNYKVGCIWARIYLFIYLLCSVFTYRQNLLTILTIANTISTNNQFPLLFLYILSFCIRFLIWNCDARFCDSGVHCILLSSHFGFPLHQNLDSIARFGLRTVDIYCFSLKCVIKSNVSI